MKRLLIVGIGSGIIGFSFGMVMTTHTDVQVVEKEHLVYVTTVQPCPPVVVVPVPKPKPVVVSIQHHHKTQNLPKLTVNAKWSDIQAP